MPETSTGGQRIHDLSTTEHLRSTGLSAYALLSAMTEPNLPTSRRFQRAAAVEHERLQHRLSGLDDELKKRREAVTALEREHEQVLEQLRSLEGLGARTGTSQSLASASARAEVEPRAGVAVIRGAAIREVAVRVLLESERASGPLHYKAWLELVESAGYQVAGKRPDAVFLNQLSRSPLVRTTTTSGVYELDRDAPERLRGELRRLQVELSRAISTSASDQSQVIEQAERQRRLSRDIARVQRWLEEAMRVLAEAGPRAVAA